MKFITPASLALSAAIVCGCSPKPSEQKETESLSNIIILQCEGSYSSDLTNKTIDQVRTYEIDMDRNTIKQWSTDKSQWVHDEESKQTVEITNSRIVWQKEYISDNQDYGSASFSTFDRITGKHNQELTIILNMTIYKDRFSADCIKVEEPDIQAKF